MEIEPSKRSARHMTLIAVSMAIAVVAMLLMSAVAQAQVTSSSSTSTQTIYHDTAVTQSVQTYSTRLLGILDGATTVYDLSFDVPFGDASVQAAIAAAESALTSAGAVSLTGPTLSSLTTTLLSSMVTAQQSNPVESGRLVAFETTVGGNGVYIYTGDRGECTPTPGTSGTYTTPYGAFTCVPGTGTVLNIQAQQINTNTNYHTIYDVDRTTTTTNTLLDSAVYVIAGRSASTSVPEPGTLALMLAGLLAILVCGRYGPTHTDCQRQTGARS